MRSEIDEVRLSDLSDLARMFEQFAVAKDSKAVPDVEMWVADTIRMIDSGRYLGLGVRKAGKLVAFVDGMTTYDTGYSRTVWVARHSYVPEEMRGDGIGELLYTEVRDRLRVQGCHWIKTTLDHPRAQHLVEKLGNSVTPQTWYDVEF